MKHYAAAAVLLLAACSKEGAAPPTNESAPGNGAAPPEAPLNPPAPGEPGGLPDDRMPVAEGPIDPKSAEGAGQVLQTYFALVEQRKIADANRLWSEGAERLNLNKYREIHANIGAPGDMEGAAGSAYVDVPVQLYGRLTNGREFNLRGTMTLRRVNDVPGSTEEQRRWHIYKADFPPLRTPAAYRFVGRWATEARNCRTLAWRFTATSLSTPAGSRCSFTRVTEVPGGYDVAARCTAEGPVVRDTLKLRFAESAKALLFDSHSIADAGLVRCD
jgi:hypothetical protein